MVESYAQHWAIETTFQECREYLKLASTKGYGQQPSCTHPLPIRFIYGDCPALSSTPEDFEKSERSLLEGQNDGDVFRYDDMCTPCHR